MARARDLWFYVGLSFLLCHELDAVAQSEWRLLPVLGGLTDANAYVAFVALHVPLFAVLLWLAASPSARTHLLTQAGIDLFLVVHAVLHASLSHRSEYTFHSTLSETLIFGGAVFGLVHLVWLWRSRASR